MTFQVNLWSYSYSTVSYYTNDTHIWEKGPRRGYNPLPYITDTTLSVVCTGKGISWNSDSHSNASGLWNGYKVCQNLDIRLHFSIKGNEGLTTPEQRLGSSYSADSILEMGFVLILKAGSTVLWFLKHQRLEITADYGFSITNVKWFIPGPFQHQNQDFLSSGEEAAKPQVLPDGAGPQLSEDHSSPCCWDGLWSLWQAVWRWRRSVWQAGLCSNQACPTNFKQNEGKSPQKKRIFNLLKCCYSHKDVQQGKEEFMDFKTGLDLKLYEFNSKNM